jgi:hypothetical protein
LKGLPNIVSAERPFIAVTTYTPNDYSASEQWALPKLEATKAWDITRGSSQIRIGINDFFTSTDINNLHNELKNGKVVYNENNLCLGHGQIVAGCGAALTDNGTGISSIGFNTSLMFTNWGANGIRLLRKNGAHIINCSWITPYISDLDTVVYNTLNQGIIITAGVGNNQQNLTYAGFGTIPQVTYPAAFYSSSTGNQVIAVTATHLDSGSEVFG